MSVTVDDVLDDANAGAEDASLAEDVLAEAEDHVDGYIEDSLIDPDKPVPDLLRDNAVKVCAGDLFASRKAPFGVQIMPDQTGTQVTTRLGFDPLSRVRPMLRRYCQQIGFAYPEDS